MLNYKLKFFNLGCSARDAILEPSFLNQDALQHVGKSSSAWQLQNGPLCVSPLCIEPPIVHLVFGVIFHKIHQSYHHHTSLKKAVEATTLPTTPNQFKSCVSIELANAGKCETNRLKPSTATRARECSNLLQGIVLNNWMHQKIMEHWCPTIWNLVVLSCCKRGTLNDNFTRRTPIPKIIASKWIPMIIQPLLLYVYIYIIWIWLFQV